MDLKVSYWSHISDLRTTAVPGYHIRSTPAIVTWLVFQSRKVGVGFVDVLTGLRQSLGIVFRLHGTDARNDVFNLVWISRYVHAGIYNERRDNGKDD
jgi:hypothetical protein